MSVLFAMTVADSHTLGDLKQQLKFIITVREARREKSVSELKSRGRQG